MTMMMTINGKIPPTKKLQNGDCDSDGDCDGDCDGGDALDDDAAFLHYCQSLKSAQSEPLPGHTPLTL